MQSTANLPVIGLDLAKTVFQLHIVDIESGEIQRRQIKRAKLAEFFAKCQRSLVAMEACGTSHHWARVIRSLGHEVKMLPAQYVKAFLLRDKTDAMDAQAIWVAAQQPHLKSVPVKTERQQSCMALHGMRRQLMKMRIMQTNALRGILAEFGIALPAGHTKLLKTIQGELARAQQADQLTADLVVSLQEQLKRIEALQGDIDQLGQRLRAMILEDRQMHAGDSADPRCWRPDGLSFGGSRRRFLDVQIGAAVCLLGRTRTSAGGHRREDTTAGNIQTGRYLLAHPLDCGGQSCHCEIREIQLDQPTSRAASLQRGGSSAGQQNGAHGLGNPGQRRNI